MSEGETVCEYNEREACRVSGSERRGRQCGSIVREGVSGGETVCKYSEGGGG